MNEQMNEKLFNHNNDYMYEKQKNEMIREWII